MENMYDIITIGSATRDVFIRSKALQIHHTKDAASHMEACFPFGAKIVVDEIIWETGGGATNNAATFSRLARLKTAAICRVGDDSSGGDIVKALKRDHVSTALVQRAEAEHSAYSTILLSGSSERTILVYHGASAKIEHSHISWSTLKTKLFYASSLSGDLKLLEKILACAKRQGAAVYMNPGGSELKFGLKKLNPLFSRLDLLVLNRDEAAQLTGVPTDDTRALMRALRKTCAHSVMTDGPNGAYAITQSGAFFIPAVSVKAVNLTGAGDAFGSAFAAGFMKYHDIKTALALGAMNAASVVQHTGAKVGILRGMPTISVINKVRATVKNLNY